MSERCNHTSAQSCLKADECAECLREGKSELASSAGSTAFVVAARVLLRQWIAHNKHDRPGAWDYDKENCRLVEESAELLGIKDPWKQ